jgi:hypothetical protein
MFYLVDSDVMDEGLSLHTLNLGFGGIFVQFHLWANIH